MNLIPNVVLKNFAGCIERTITKVYPKGTLVAETRFFRKPNSALVNFGTPTMKRTILLPENNPLYKQGLRGFYVESRQAGNKKLKPFITALGEDKTGKGKVKWDAGFSEKTMEGYKSVATGLKDIKELINSMKKYGCSMD